MMRVNHLIGFGAGGETLIPFPTITSMQHRYVASLGVTGDPVTAWADQIGSANLSNGAGSPDFEATGGPNGGPCITFDGSNEELSVSGLSTVSQPYHYFMVCKQITWTANDYILSGNSSGFSFVRQKQSGGSQYDVEQGANVPAANTVDPGDTDWHFYSSFFNGSSSYQELDGTKSGPSNCGSGSFNGISVGGGFGSNYANVSISEVLMADAEVTGTDLANLEAYIASNYGISFS